MSVKITYFVHGTTVDNQDKLATGWIPGELSQKGIEQSIELKNQVNINEFDIVFCSDLKRAVDSANLTFKGYKDILQDSRLRECNYGDLNGKQNDLVKYENHINEKFPNGESMEDIEKRVKEFLNYLKNNYNDKHVAIVAHKAPQLALEVLLNNRTWGQAIDEDWRKIKAWKPGWVYIIE